MSVEPVSQRKTHEARSSVTYSTGLANRLHLKTYPIDPHKSPMLTALSAQTSQPAATSGPIKGRERHSAVCTRNRRKRRVLPLAKARKTRRSQPGATPV